jgi:hypothetical protein
VRRTTTEPMTRLLPFATRFSPELLPSAGRLSGGLGFRTLRDGLAEAHENVRT